MVSKGFTIYQKNFAKWVANQNTGFCFILPSDAAGYIIGSNSSRMWGDCVTQPIREGDYVPHGTNESMPSTILDADPAISLVCLYHLVHNTLL